MLYLFKSFWVFSDGPTIYRNIVALLPCWFVSLSRASYISLKARACMGSRDCARHARAPDCVDELVRVLTTSNFTHRLKHLESWWLFFSLEGRCNIGNLRYQTLLWPVERWVLSACWGWPVSSFVLRFLLCLKFASDYVFFFVFNSRQTEKQSTQSCFFVYLACNWTSGSLFSCLLLLRHLVVMVNRERAHEHPTAESNPGRRVFRPENI